MKIISNDLNGVLRIKVNKQVDSRGWFCEGYNERDFKQLGIDIKFIQDNYSLTKQKGTIRGLHYQEAPYEQTKLFRCIKGRVFDVVVDLRKDSDSFLKWTSFELNEEEFEWILVPKGFAHGFLSLSEECIVQYRVDEYYDKAYDRGIIWNDPLVNVAWPILTPILSEKDSQAPGVAQISMLKGKIGLI